MRIFVQFWSLWTQGREYGFKSSIYMGGFHRGQDIPGGGWGTRAVPALLGGVVYSTYRTAKLGWVIVIDIGVAQARKHGTGRFHAYCHMAEDGSVRRGTRVSQGDRLGRLAGWTDRPGIIFVTWFGPHLHFVISNYVDGAHVNRVTKDPRPLIRKLLAAATTTPTKPRPLPTPKPKPVAKPEPEPLPIPVPEEEEEPMEYGQLHTTREDGKMIRRAFYVPGTAYFVVWDSNDATLANTLSKRYETGDSVAVNLAVFNQFRDAAAAVAGK